MADGTQHGFNFPRKALASALRPGEIVVDFFAGGGGASEALRQALGRDPDVAVNHDHLAIGMHAANHPFTRHMEADVWTVDILREVAGRRVGWFHASPDCTHFSQAKGGQPRDRATRSLSWVVLKVAGTLAKRGLAPRIISLENVRQILGWCPLVAKRDKATGRVVKLGGSIATPGERVPLREQFLIPDKRRAGHTWLRFVAALRALGYAVEWRILRACDYGAGTSRERLFLIARRDGQPIRWPERTHGPGRAHPYVTAADCIDWSVPCPSIFTRRKPLADATHRRIAKGIHRYVLGAAQPFIVSPCPQGPTQEPHHGVSTRQDLQGQDHQIQRRGHGARPLHQRMQPSVAGTTGGQRRKVAGFPVVRRAAVERNGGAADRAGQLGHAGAGQDGPEALTAPFITEHANGSNQRTMPATDPLRTQCAAVKGGHFALVSAILAGVGGRAGDTEPRSVSEPCYTVTAKADCAVVTAFLEQAHGGGDHGNPARARGADEPVSTISTTGSQQRLVAAELAQLSPEHEAGALRVAAFLMRYHGTGGQHAELSGPLTTVTTKDRLALVTVTIKGTPYVIVDIGLRMLRREELYRAQGFPAGYIIDRTAAGQPLSISASVRMVGNSVSPPPLAAIARENLDQVAAPEALAA